MSHQQHRSHEEQPPTAIIWSSGSFQALQPPWWGIPPSLPRTVSAGSCASAQHLQRKRGQLQGSAAPDPLKARATPTGADASVEVLESGQISLEMSLFPSTALMSFAELPAGLGIPGC